MNIFELTTLLILSLHVFHSDSISVENIAIQNFRKKNSIKLMYKNIE